MDSRICSVVSGGNWPLKIKCNANQLLLLYCFISEGKYMQFIVFHNLFSCMKKVDTHDSSKILIGNVGLTVMDAGHFR